MGPFFDMHCHLDFAPNAPQAADELQGIGAGVFSATVIPSDYSAASTLFLDTPCIRVGVGLHPWWISSNQSAARVQVDQALALVESTDFVGEVGLDFSPAYKKTRGVQCLAFEAIMAACARCGGKTITIHAVHSASAVLDALEASGVLSSCACILHWYSGSSQDLSRALRAGCYVSLGAKSLATKRGREYAKAIPLDHLLLETDMPAQGRVYNVAEIQTQLAGVLAEMARLRKENPDVLIQTIGVSSKRLLKL